jgi:hypothetical protein
MVHRLNSALTASLLSREASATTVELILDAAAGQYDRAAYEGFPGGGFVVVNRAAYSATGGIPASFVGWGGEDETLALILNTLLGRFERLGADLVHLYHAPQASQATHVGFANRQLWQRFRAAAGNVDAMWRLVQKPHVSTPLSIAEQKIMQQERREQARARLAGQLRTARR